VNRKFSLFPFSPKNGSKICAKKVPQSPFRGDVGKGFRGIDGGKIRRYDARQAQAERPRPSKPPPPRRRPEGGDEVPNAVELLVQQTQEAERLRLLLLANECKDLDEFRKRLSDLLKQTSM